MRNLIQLGFLSLFMLLFNVGDGRGQDEEQSRPARTQKKEQQSKSTGAQMQQKQQSKSGAGYTIDEYYRLLTAKHLPILNKYKDRGAIVKDLDYSNNYILLAHDEWKGWGEMTLFEKTGGGHLIAVTQYDCTDKYPSYPYFSRSKCSGSTYFLELEKNAALVEAKNIMPDIKSLMLYGFYEKKTKRLADSEDKLIFELPRERRDILIRLAGETVYSLVWNGHKFEGDYVN